MAQSGHFYMRCSLKKCLSNNNTITKSASRFEVCTVVPEKLTKNQQHKMAIDWSKNGEATFHTECWNSIVQSSRARNPKKSKLTLTTAEKAMVKEAAKTAEKHDELDFVLEEGRRIAEMITNAKHCVAFTGAGISTSAGIGDYRGKSGKWTQDDRASVQVPVNCDAADDAADEPRRKKQKDDDSSNDMAHDEGQEEADTDESEVCEGVPYEKLRPTFTHEALRKLLETGHLKHIISQNGDGLHRLSGVQMNRISELHGNVFLETCEKCCRLYERDTYVLDDVASQYFEELEENGKTSIRKPRHAVQCQLCTLSHRTGRKCTQKGCKGFLKDTIINFQDNLEEAILDAAMDHAKKCDLMLCLGTTLRVTPACELVEMGAQPLRLVICNRQKTPLDSLCLTKDKNITLGCRVFGDCDTLMTEIMKNILPAEALQQWTEGRSERMRVYDSKRS